MQLVLRIIHVLVSALLITAILVQAKGVGLSTAFGGGGEVFRTKRGAEKIIFILTIILAVLFAATSIANVVLG
ncbi:MAG: preprotein translocase subunit SecG [Candidatus Cloacimonetes bacterium]|nr:preprotein translocase subunit SecG [Candidatus Cloacimonadota bacterium]